MEKPFCNLYYGGEAKNSGFPRLLPHICIEATTTAILPNTLENGFSFKKNHFTVVATATAVLATAEALPKGP
jgi:hypothetical protein